MGKGRRWEEGRKGRSIKKKANWREGEETLKIRKQEERLRKRKEVLNTMSKSRVEDPSAMALI